MTRGNTLSPAMRKALTNARTDAHGDLYIDHQVNVSTVVALLVRGLALPGASNYLTTDGMRVRESLLAQVERKGVGE